MPSPPTVARGLAGVTVADSSICWIDGEHGELTYRGHDIADLAAHATFEEVAHLLWMGDLPDRSELATLQDALARARALPPGALDVVRSLPRSARPMHALRTLVSALGSFVSVRRGGLEQAIGLTGAIATGIAAFQRYREQLMPLEPRAELSHAANFLWSLHGEVPEPEAARALDVALILHMEHGFNASTFAARVATSTEADMHGAVTAAVATLAGPLHGGANERVMQMLASIPGPDQAPDWVRARLQAGDKVMGFGHRVYRTVDPRATALRGLACDRLRAAGLEQMFATSIAVEETVGSELGHRGIAANVDFYSAGLYHALGIPIDLFTPVFAAARIVGWTAHILEQTADNRLIRPKASYTGPPTRAFVALDRR